MRIFARFPLLLLPPFAFPAEAHEAWLLEPSHIAHLEQDPLPALFTSPLVMGVATGFAFLAVGAVLKAERRLRPAEARLFAPLARLAPEIGPLVLRIGLAIMLILAAAGGLPRHGTARWIEPTLFVPDMQLSLVPGWAELGTIEIVLALMLAAGFLTRIAGLGLVALAGLGLMAFGAPILDYALHFVAPGLVLAIFGGGRLSIDRAIGTEAWMQPSERLAGITWNAAIGLMGGGFVYLGVTCKLTQPMLLMAILEEGGVPLFGLPVAVAALVMTGVELVAGLLLAMGRLIRPIAVFLIGAFTFFAIVLGENPLFHANLYAMMILLLMSGRELPSAVTETISETPTDPAQI